MCVHWTSAGCRASGHTGCEILDELKSKVLNKVMLFLECVLLTYYNILAVGVCRDSW